MLVDNFANRLNDALLKRNKKASEVVNISEQLYSEGKINKPLTKPLLSHYLKGTYEAKQDNVYALSIILDVDEAWLMGYDVPMKKTLKIAKNNDAFAVVLVYGTIPAGIPMECIEDILDTEEISADMLNRW